MPRARCLFRALGNRQSTPANGAGHPAAVVPWSAAAELPLFGIPGTEERELRSHSPKTVVRERSAFSTMGRETGTGRSESNTTVRLGRCEVFSNFWPGT
jgi:hypothetical protein